MAIAILIFMMLALFSMHHAVGTARRTSINKAGRANIMLTQAESALHLGDWMRASLLFSNAYTMAMDSDMPLYAAEASYGLARIARSRGDAPGEEQYLKQALRDRTRLLRQKPNFVALLESELDQCGLPPGARN